MRGDTSHYFLSEGDTSHYFLGEGDTSHYFLGEGGILVLVYFSRSYYFLLV